MSLLCIDINYKLSQQFESFLSICFLYLRIETNVNICMKRKALGVIWVVFNWILIGLVMAKLNKETL